LKISDKQYSDISVFINEHFKEYYAKYDFKKYSVDQYREFQESFFNLKVPNQNIENALKWKWGHTGKTNYPQTHKEIVKEVEDNWNQFVRAKYTNPKDTFDYWKNIFNRNTTFITTAYITHLVHHVHIPIIDQHNYRAYNTLMKCFVDNNHKFKSKPSSWDDILQLKEFINRISNMTKIDIEKLDKFLMMYGKFLKDK